MGLKNEKIIIGIAGPSGSGKTPISKRLVKKLKAKLISLDNYWKYNYLKKIPQMKELKKGIWEKPSATDFIKASIDINKLKNVKGKKYIIVEGLHTFNNQKMRKMLNFKIYVDIPDNLIVERRLKKFGSKDNQEWYSKNIAIKFYKKYGKPTKRYADLIIRGDRDINANLKKILNYMKKLKCL